MTAPGRALPAASRTRVRNCCSEPQQTTAPSRRRTLLRAIPRILGPLRVEGNEGALVDGGEEVDDVAAREAPLLVVGVDRIHVVARRPVLVVEARLPQRHLVLLVAAGVVHEQL